MRRFIIRFASSFALVALVHGAIVLAQNPPGAGRKTIKVPRAIPPSWGPEVDDIYFPDAREKLSGDRPVFGVPRAATGGNVAANVPTDPSPASGGEGPAGSGWSAVIDAETLEDEVKRIHKQLGAVVTTPGPFKGGGYSAARTLYSELAVLFGIIAEYPTDVRWKAKAPGLRDSFAKAGFNCKVGTDQSYNEAKGRLQDLDELVRGGEVQAGEGGIDITFEKVANRPPLMQRMEAAFQKNLSPWLSNEGEFSKNSAEIMHEAQILQAISEVIQKPNYEFHDDEGYIEQAKMMASGAREIVEAVKLKNYEAARKGAAGVTKACSQCHEGYRSS